MNVRSSIESILQELREATNASVSVREVSVTATSSVEGKAAVECVKLVVDVVPISIDGDYGK
jgi:hypothetical protein